MGIYHCKLKCIIMRKLTLYLFILLNTTVVFGQEPLILPGDEAFSLGTEPAYIIDIEGLSHEEATDAWVDFTKKQKAKAKKNKSGEYFSDDISIPQISNNTIDLYAVFENTPEGSRGKFWFDLGGAYFSDDRFPDRVASQRAFLANYIRALEAKKIDKEVAVLEKELKSESKSIKKKKKEMKKLTKTNEKLKKKVDENNAKLDKLSDENQSGLTENQRKEDKVKDLKSKAKSMRN